MLSLLWLGVTQSHCHQMVVRQLLQARQWIHSWWMIGAEVLTLWKFSLLLAVLVRLEE